MLPFLRPAFSVNESVSLADDESRDNLKGCPLTVAISVAVEASQIEVAIDASISSTLVAVAIRVTIYRASVAVKTNVLSQ